MRRRRSRRDLDTGHAVGAARRGRVPRRGRLGVRRIARSRCARGRGRDDARRSSRRSDRAHRLDGPHGHDARHGRTARRKHATLGKLETAYRHFFDFPGLEVSDCTMRWTFADREAAIAELAAARAGDRGPRPSSRGPPGAARRLRRGDRRRPRRRDVVRDDLRAASVTRVAGGSVVEQRRPPLPRRPTEVPARDELSVTTTTAMATELRMAGQFRRMPELCDLCGAFL